MNTRSLACSVLVAGLSLPVLGAGPRTSERFSYSTYKEETEGYVALVDGYPASLRGKAPYVPVPIAFGLRAGIPNVVLDSESFELIDAHGTVYPLAGYEEVTSAYDMMSFDRALLERRPLVAGLKFASSHRVTSRFFPVPGRDLRVGRVELGPYTWFTDLLYFPRPEAGVEGVLTLRIKGRGLTAPIEIGFLAEEGRRRSK